MSRNQHRKPLWLLRLYNELHLRRGRRPLLRKTTHILLFGHYFCRHCRVVDRFYIPTRVADGSVLKTVGFWNASAYTIEGACTRIWCVQQPFFSSPHPRHYRPRDFTTYVNGASRLRAAYSTDCYRIKTVYLHVVIITTTLTLCHVIGRSRTVHHEHKRRRLITPENVTLSAQ